MASTLTNFIIGLGFSFDTETTKQADAALESVKTKALQVGAALAGAFGLKALTLDFANANDSIGKFSETFGVIPDDVAALGRALQIEGGSLNGFISQLERIERLRAGLLIGDAAFIARAGIAGIDTSELISATNATEAYISLADQFARMTTQQRINAASALGLDAASIRLLSRGSESLREMVAVQQRIRPITEEMTDVSTQFNIELQNIMSNVGGVADRISVKMIPAITNVIAGMNAWIEVNRKFNNERIDAAVDAVIDSPTASTVGAGLLGAGALRAGAKAVTKVPLVGGAAGASLTAASKLTIAGTALLVAAQRWNDTADDFEDLTGIRNDFTEWLFARPINLDELFGLNDPDSAVSPTSAASVIMQLSPATGGPQQGQPRSAPVPLRPVVIENKVILDGEVISRRINDVNEQNYSKTLDEITNSTGG